MGELPLLLGIDAVTVPVPDLDAGLAFYQGLLGHQLLWRNDDVGQAGLALVEQGTELVLTTTAPYAPTWLVSLRPLDASRRGPYGSAAARL